MNTMLRSMGVLGAWLAVSLAGRAAQADPALGGVRGEATMGFLARRSDARALSFRAQGAAPSLSETFQRAPLDAVQSYGLRYDLRLVVSYVRMTVGADVPFAQLGPTAASRDGAFDTSPRALREWALRFGLGGEVPVGPVGLYVDLLGAVHFVDATVAVDGVERGYDAQLFGLSTRAGVRLRVRPWFFVAASGEVGLTGPTVWAADLSAGFALGDSAR